MEGAAVFHATSGFFCIFEYGMIHFKSGDNDLPVLSIYYVRSLGSRALWCVESGFRLPFQSKLCCHAGSLTCKHVQPWLFDGEWFHYQHFVLYRDTWCCRCLTALETVATLSAHLHESHGFACGKKPKNTAKINKYQWNLQWYNICQIEWHHHHIYVQDSGRGLAPNMLWPCGAETCTSGDLSHACFAIPKVQHVLLGILMYLVQ